MAVDMLTRSVGTKWTRVNHREHDMECLSDIRSFDAVCEETRDTSPLGLGPPRPAFFISLTGIHEINSQSAPVIILRLNTYLHCPFFIAEFILKLLWNSCAS